MKTIFPVLFVALVFLPNNSYSEDAIKLNCAAMECVETTVHMTVPQPTSLEAIYQLAQLMIAAAEFRAGGCEYSIDVLSIDGPNEGPGGSGQSHEGKLILAGEVG